MGSKRRDRYIRWRGGVAYYYRRTPVDVRGIDSRVFIEQSLKTTDLTIAEARRDAVNAATEDLWGQYRAMTNPRPLLKRYSAAVKAAQTLGYPYKHMDDVLSASDEELIGRLHILKEAPAKEVAASALMGNIKKPNLRISEVLDAFWSLAADRIIDKSEHQIRVWKSPRIRATNNFIKVVRNKQIDEIDRLDILSFRNWWLDRVQTGKARADTANKDFTHLSDVFQTVVDAYQLDLSNPFRGLRLKEKSSNTRRSLTVDEVMTHIMGENCLVGLNEDARAIVRICAETGARPAEIINRATEDIQLDASVPHVKLRPNHFGELKTPTSERDIPLVGSALTTFRKYPSGFPKYAGKATTAVNVINKYFRENDVLPSGATLYSLRHAFQDRLIAVRAPERVQADLMGHRLHRPRYGAGPDLAERLYWMQKVALVKT